MDKRSNIKNAKANTGKNASEENAGLQKSYDEKLVEQKRADALRELENMRKWVDEDVPPPKKLSCKISKHLVPNERNE